jgi:hypothetical protein
VKTSLSVIEYLRVVLAAGYPEFLVSAFDLNKLSSSDADKVRQQLNFAIAAKNTVLFDSGNYESYWLRDETWSQTDFHRVIEGFPCSFMFSFDVRVASNDPKTVARAVLSSLEVDRKAAAGIPVVPIVHGTPLSLPQIVSDVAASSGVEMIAIPERELGVGILQRAQTVVQIRRQLSEGGSEALIHLLGTGSPLAIAAYAMLGANTFDGLEWCQTAVDVFTGNLHHLSQGELFFDENKYRESGLGAGMYTLVSNLNFFRSHVEILRDSSAKSEFPEAYAELLKRAEGLRKRAGL